MAECNMLLLLLLRVFLANVRNEDESDNSMKKRIKSRKDSRCSSVIF